MSQRVHPAWGIIPAAAGIVNGAFKLATPPPAPAPAAAVTTAAAHTRTTTTRSAAGAKTFKIPMQNLTTWSAHVIVTLNGVQITGHSGVHPLASDCELHFGANTADFKGVPAGLVLEPMNACDEPSPVAGESWVALADSITNTQVAATGVPRIWPEHLTGEESDSNPNHAVELHPLISVKQSNGAVIDFSKLDVAPEGFEGGVKLGTALAIIDNASVGVTRSGETVTVDFRAGTIGNFTVLDVVIPKTGIEDDGAGSFRIEGEVVLNDGTTEPVHMVAAAGTPVAKQIAAIQSGSEESVRSTQLALFSLSPGALLDAANRSNGRRVAVDGPIQLILYGEVAPE
jgi:hypothetical protein